MKFFKPEDFEMQKFSPKQSADFANGKLEREGKIVSNYTTEYLGQGWTEIGSGTKNTTHRALLISIEPIKSLEKCTHPNILVRPIFNINIADEIEYFKCDCGKTVRPKIFEEI